MKTETGRKILEFIRKKGQTTPKEIISFIGFSAPAIFRQLKKLQDKGLIQKSGRPPTVYYHLPMSAKEKIFAQAIKWAAIKPAVGADKEYYCETRDVFQARQERLPRELINITGDDQLSFLLAAAVGEIGNNSFDHNLANWPDIPGIIFKLDAAGRMLVLADRGQGVRATLRKIKPEIADDQEALRLAFTEIISGRFPERRGNGLKFVKKVFEENDLKLHFYSGLGRCEIKNGATSFGIFSKNIPGTIAMIEF